MVFLCLRIRNSSCVSSAYNFRELWDLEWTRKRYVAWRYVYFLHNHCGRKHQSTNQFFWVYILDVVLDFRFNSSLLYCVYDVLIMDNVIYCLWTDGSYNWNDLKLPGSFLLFVLLYYGWWGHYDVRSWDQILYFVETRVDWTKEEINYQKR